MAKPKPKAILDAEAIIKAAIAQSDQIITLEDDEGHAALGDLNQVLVAADKKLGKKLAALAKAGKGRTFTAAQAAATQAQIQPTIVAVQEKIGGIAQRTGESAIGKAVEHSAKTIAKIDEAYHGGATITPSLLASMQMSHVKHGPKAALVTRVSTSLDRYGMNMGKEFSKILQVGLASGATMDQMVASLVAHGGPKGTVSLASKEIAPGIIKQLELGHFPGGLFKAKKYWAERIVRTEVAYAYNGATHASLQQLREDGADVRKKILATFDTRTAPDSIAVHGQIRELDQTFTDGHGRVYLFPPARPNDRETIIGWFPAWHETPSSEPPTESEQKDAVELANPQPKPPAWSGFSQQDLEDLKNQGLLADKAQAERELEEQTRAGQALHTMQLAQSAKVAGIRAQAAQAAADAEKAEKAAAEKTYKALDAKIAKAFKVSKKAPATPHEGALALYHLSATDPEKFAKYYNQKTGQTGVSQKSIVLALKQSSNAGSTLMVETLVDELTEKHGYGDGVLKSWLGTKPAQAHVSALSGKKDPASLKQKVALLVADGTPLKLAKMTAKKESQTWKTYVAKNGQPPKVDWEIKPGGGEFFDVYDPLTQQKVAYFKKAGEKFAVTPPAKLGSEWTARTFEKQSDAAEYAAQVGAAISKVTPAKPVAAAPAYTPYKAPAKDSRFNHRDDKPAKTSIGPLVLELDAAAESKEIKYTAAHHFKEMGGVTIRKADGKSQNGVDQVVIAAGLKNEHDAWAGKFGGCWYGSSTGAKAYAGKLVTKDETTQDARDMAEQIGNGADAKKLERWARVKYAATQAALEHRSKPGGDLHGKIDADGYVELYRGVNGNQAQKARSSRQEGEKARVAVRSVSSWSHSRSTARGFAGSGGVVLRARVHVSRIFSQYEQEETAMRRFGDGEAEWIVIAEKEHFDMHVEDIQNPHDE